MIRCRLLHGNDSGHSGATGDAEDVRENGDYTILLAHRPEEIERYSKSALISCFQVTHMVVSGDCLESSTACLLRIRGVSLLRLAGNTREWHNTDRQPRVGEESTRIPRIFNRPELVSSIWRARGEWRLS